MSTSITNALGVTYKVGDKVFGYSPGLYEITGIGTRDNPALLSTKAVLDGKYRPIKRARGITNFHMGFAVLFTEAELNKRIEQVKRDTEELLKNMEAARPLVNK